MSIPKLGGERPGQDRPLGDRPYSDKPGDKTRDKIRNVLGKASVNTGLGKLPPQAIDLEEAVLGALMLEKDALTTVIEILQVESFYREPHQKIYEAILMLFDNSEPVDILTVTNQLRKNGTLEFAGGPFFVSGLTQRVNSAANVEYHARIVSEKAIKRHLIGIASEIEREAYEDTTDTFALLDRVEQEIFNVSEVNIRKNYADMRSMMREAITELEAKKQHKDGLTGVPTGFTNLDRLTSGWQKSDLVIIAARPAMGKTAFVLSALRNAAVDFKHSVAIFSLEMSSIQLVNRLISAEAELESEKIKRGSLREDEWQQLYAKTSRLTEAPIFIDDTPALSIRELRSKCRRLKAQHNIELIIIDYLQLMTGDASRTGGGNREQEIASISRALKNIAKELEVPVIALSQLSRAVETRGGDKRPQLSDLRESGCLTGDALVFDAQTGEQVPIAELVQRKAAGQLDGFRAMATDSQWKLSGHPVSNAFYSGKKEVFELTTRSGRSIKASANHPFLKLSGWTRLDELKVGDKLAVPRTLPASAPTNPMSEDELILLAHLLGDGCILPKQPYHYTSADPANGAIVQNTAKRLFNIDGKTVCQQNWEHYYLSCPYHLTHGRKHPITHWYESLGLDRVRSYDKKIPNAVFRGDSQRIALFLHHLWATDGNISNHQTKSGEHQVSIYYASSSQQLAQQVQHLLLRLGILSTVREQTSAKYRSMYHVLIYGRDEQLKFLQQVGCYGQRGQIVPQLIKHLSSIDSNPNFDVVPQEAWDIFIRQYQAAFSLTQRSFAKALDMQYCGTALHKNGISRARMQRIYQVLPFATLKHLADSDVLWDEIISIRSLGAQDVYDITVDSAHNFVANDFVTHNSIEQDADMVMFLYRPEYYGLTEDSEGQPVQGIGEIIISKHRNGALDTVQLKFIGKFTKFTNLHEVSSGDNYGSALQSASLDDTFKDPGIVTFASKANDRPNNPDDESFERGSPPEDEAPF